jgi:hypothetical protein
MLHMQGLKRLTTAAMSSKSAVSRAGVSSKSALSRPDVDDGDSCYVVSCSGAAHDHALVCPEQSAA